MKTEIIELRMAVRVLPTDSKDVQLAVKAEVLRLAELLEQDESAQPSVQAGGGTDPEQERIENELSKWGHPSRR